MGKHHHHTNRRRLAGAALLTGLAFAAACGTPTKQVQVAAAPAAESPDVLTRISEEAGSAWAARVAISDEYAELVAADRGAAVMARINEEAGSAWAARVAISDEYAELVADEAAENLDGAAQRHFERLIDRR